MSDRDPAASPATNLSHASAANGKGAPIRPA